METWEFYIGEFWIQCTWNATNYPRDSGLAKFHGYPHTRIGSHLSLSSGESLESKYLKKKQHYSFFNIIFSITHQRLWISLILQCLCYAVHCFTLMVQKAKKIIWRNDVLFTNLHSGHLGISMMDSNTTEYIEKKKLFSNYPATGNSEIFLSHLVLYFTQSRIGMC